MCVETLTRDRVECSKRVKYPPCLQWKRYVHRGNGQFLWHQVCVHLGRSRSIGLVHHDPGAGTNLGQHLLLVPIYAPSEHGLVNRRKSYLTLVRLDVLVNSLSPPPSFDSELRREFPF